MLAVKELQAIKVGEWATDGPAGPGKGSGVLAFRRVTSGALMAYFRYTRSNGSRGAYPLGQMAERGRAGLSLVRVREKASELAQLYLSGQKDIDAYFESEARAKAEELARSQAEAEAAEAAARRAEEEKNKFSLEALLKAYTDHLENIGKAQTARDVRSIFKVNILKPAPSLATTPAREVTKAVLAARIREIRESGKERAAGKTRAYLFAAYNLALRAEGDTEAPAALIQFHIENNPLTGIKAIPVRPAERTLSRDELLKFISKLGSSLADQALKLCIFSGGQRAEQLLRARCSDYDPATAILRLWDRKGRRLQPREHRLPLGPIAADLCKALVLRAKDEQPDEADPLLFANGTKALVPTTLTHRVADLSSAMGGAKFSFRDLRRTTETEMASIGFSVDLRAQLMSHGLSGVQMKHYDRHSYLTEKKTALETWEYHLEGKELPKAVSVDSGPT